MNCKFERSFEKDFRKVKNKKLASAIFEAIKYVERASNISDIPKIKKLLST